MGFLFLLTALSTLQKGKLPRIMSAELLTEVFFSEAPRKFGLFGFVSGIMYNYSKKNICLALLFQKTLRAINMTHLIIFDFCSKTAVFGVTVLTQDRILFAL